MINIFVAMKHLQNLTSSEKTVADFILANPENITNMSVKDLAVACYVSVTIIYRLCEKLGLGGFSDLKIKISQSLTDYLKNDAKLDYNFPIKENQTEYEILTGLKENYEQTLLNTLNLIDLKQLQNVVSKMKKARNITIFTATNNVFFAQSFKMQMREIGVVVEVPVDEYEQRLLATTSGNGDFAIIISYGGRLVNIDMIAGILNQKGATILLISSCDYGFKDVKPDYHFYMSSYEHQYKKISAFSTRLSLLYILDSLYSCYFELDYSNNLERKISFYKQASYPEEKK